MESYRRAVELKPDDAGILAGYAESLETMHRAEDAEVQWKKVLKLMPDHMAAREALDRLKG